MIGYILKNGYVKVGKYVLFHDNCFNFKINEKVEVLFVNLSETLEIGEVIEYVEPEVESEDEWLNEI